MNRIVLTGVIALATGMFLSGCKDTSGVDHIALTATPVDVVIDGTLDDNEWQDANIITSFTKPWDGGADKETTFLIQADSSYLYFAFDVVDQEVVVVPSAHEQAVADGDRVELFFARDMNLNEYYCFEMGPDGKVLDYQASFYRKFDNTWNCPDLDLVGIRKDHGYVVEGRIPFSRLHELGLLKPDGTGSFFYMGAYRGAYDTTSPQDTTIQWTTWVDPQVAEPDFHIPSSFGTVSYDVPVPQRGAPQTP